MPTFRVFYKGVLSLLVLLSACKTDYENLPAFNQKKYLQAVIEIPAGTNQQLQYNPKSHEFRNASGHTIRFLPYPGNYGFIPSTRMPGERRGDEQPMDILVLAESQPSGTVLEVIPVGILYLERDNLPDPKIIAVPAKPSLQIIDATDYTSFNRDYPVIKQMLTQWFTHANPSQKVRILGWKDEQIAEEQVRKHMR